MKGVEIEDRRRSSQVKKERHSMGRRSMDNENEQHAEAKAEIDIEIQKSLTSLGLGDNKRNHAALIDETIPKDAQPQEDNGEQPRKRRRRVSYNQQSQSDATSPAPSPALVVAEKNAMADLPQILKANFEVFLKSTQPERMTTIEQKRVMINKLETAKDNLFAEQKKIYEQKLKEIEDKIAGEIKGLEKQISDAEEIAYPEFIKKEFEKINKPQVPEPAAAPQQQQQQPAEAPVLMMMMNEPQN